jgi:hypothetical protein
VARPCSVCQHPARDAIDRAIVAGAPFRRIARQHGLSPDAVERHSAAHVAKALSKARDAAAVVHGDSLLAEIVAIRDRAAELGQQAEEKGDLRTALFAVRELRGATELLARLTLEARSDGGAHAIAQSPVWRDLVADIVSALAPFPEARTAFTAVVRRRLGREHDVETASAIVVGNRR